ncbi:hypothetical protein MCOR21_005399 [Pyricularia oryzae]|uniref:Uncharacterized protein n=1 Tax=Pyricularia oryzae TaxID=318829 RepID=A0A4P7NVN7_PYROR|nr:hypothetical protein MCOR21_005399 [Pyricularia oryzae]QBZ66532.1 hypothetical protein PoMZ_13511 [Pyricularia oryzae]
MRFTTSVLATLIAVVAAAPAPEAASVDSNVQLATSLVQVLDPDLPFMLASEKLKAQGCRDEKTFLECLLNGCPPIIPPGGCISEITCYIIWCT